MTKQSPRSIATRRVMKTIARHVARQPLPTRLDDGSSPVIVALPEDALANVVAQVDAIGGRANVFVAFPDRLALIDTSIDGLNPTPENHQKSHANTTMAMYVEFLRHTNGESVTVTVNSSRASHASSVQDVAYAF